MLNISASFHNSESLVKQNNEKSCDYPVLVSQTRKILAANLLRLMAEGRLGLDSRKKLSDRSGVAIGSVSNMASGDMALSSPNLDSVEGVARAYTLPTWRLLHPELGLVKLPETGAPDLGNIYSAGDSDRSEIGITNEGATLNYVDVLKQVTQDWLTLDIEDRDRWAQELHAAAEARRARRIALAPVRKHDFKKKEEK